MIHITMESVLGALQRAVDNKPKGYVYTNDQGEVAVTDRQGYPMVSCNYVHVDEISGALVPGCIVGTILADLGVPLSDLVQNGSADYRLEELEYEGVADTSSDVRIFLMKIQRMQDTGTPWSELADSL